MRYFFLVLLIMSAAIACLGQQPTPTPERNVSSSGGPILPPSRPVGDLIKMRPNGYTRPDPATRRSRFIDSTVGPIALTQIISRAGLSTWSNSPEEWGTRWEGFGRRVASNFGTNAIRQTTQFGLDEAFKTDSYFYRSKNKGIGARIRNAVISPVTARDRNGKRVIGLANLTGAYTAGIISYETWYPKRYDWKDGVRTGTYTLGFDAAFNLFKEFIWKK